MVTAKTLVLLPVWVAFAFITGVGVLSWVMAPILGKPALLLSGTICLTPYLYLRHRRADTTVIPFWTRLEKLA